MITTITKILESYSVDDLNNLKSIITEFENKKRERYSNSTTVVAFKYEYENYIKNNFSMSYLKSIKLSFDHLMNFFSENKSLAELSIKNAEDFKNHLMKKAPLGYKIYLRNLKAAFNRAVDWHMIPSNPFIKIKISKHQQISPKFLKLHELNAVLKKTKSSVISDLFLFAFYTGCRPGEIIKLRWGNIDLNKRLITIGDKNLTTKNRRSRVVPICNELFQGLNHRCNGKTNDDFVFSKSNGFPFNRDYISRYFKKALRAAGLDEDLHLYNLRHSFASTLAGKGVPIIAVKDLLGHSSIVTTQIYSHSDLESLQKAIGKFDE